ncbi:MAG TPA: N-acetyltransferase [Candidatus Tetragenococcus pullicola]|nr:N-acetyltransferase [Candidatus Tetragenococcus pullicola]
MEIKQEENRVVLVEKDGKEAGELTWKKVEDGVVDFNHTFVDPTYRGQGVAGKLMQAAVFRARKENWQVIPTCSYAVKAFNDKSEYQDVLKK